MVVTRSPSRIIPRRFTHQPEYAALYSSLPLSFYPQSRFADVISACATERDEGTWIGRDVQQAYCQLHALGHAHSLEVWLENELVGGLYGVAVGAVFCGESMFSRADNASKVH